jgi:hypothetical protein
MPQKAKPSEAARVVRCPPMRPEPPKPLDYPAPSPRRKWSRSQWLAFAVAVCFWTVLAFYLVLFVLFVTGFLNVDVIWTGF